MEEINARTPVLLSGPADLCYAVVQATAKHSLCLVSLNLISEK